MLLERISSLLGISISSLAAPLLIGGGLLAGAGPAWVIGKMVGHEAGVQVAAAECRAASLEATIAAKDQDLRAARELATANAIEAHQQHAAVLEAQQRISDYEAELSRRGADSRCALNSADVRRLRGTAPGRRGGAGKAGSSASLERDPGSGPGP